MFFFAIIVCFSREVMEWRIKCHGGSYNVHESILCRNSTAAKSNYFFAYFRNFCIILTFKDLWIYWYFIFRFFPKYLRWKHLKAKIDRNFDNMQKTIGFCGGRISTKNLFMDVIWTPVTFYPSFHHLTRW